MNGATSQTDITNFRNAVRFYSISKPDGNVGCMAGQLG